MIDRAEFVVPLLGATDNQDAEETAEKFTGPVVLVTFTVCADGVGGPPTGEVNERDDELTAIEQVTFSPTFNCTLPSGALTIALPPYVPGCRVTDAHLTETVIVPGVVPELGEMSMPSGPRKALTINGPFLPLVTVTWADVGPLGHESVTFDGLTIVAQNPVTPRKDASVREQNHLKLNFVIVAIRIMQLRLSTMSINQDCASVTVMCTTVIWTESPLP